MTKIAFEVEIISTRQNFVHVLDEEANCVYLYDTSRKLDGTYGKFLVKTFKEEDFYNFDCKDAEELFKQLYRKSLTPSTIKPMFLGWVDHETFEQIEEE